MKGAEMDRRGGELGGMDRGILGVTETRKEGAEDGAFVKNKNEKSEPGKWMDCRARSTT